MRKPIEEINDILRVLRIEDQNILLANRKKALMFFKQLESGFVRETCDKLSLRLNVTPRRVREVYFKPFVSEGIIRILDFENKNRKWKWVGYEGIKPKYKRREKNDGNSSF